MTDPPRRDPHGGVAVTRKPMDEARRCHATSRSGERCKRAAIRGGAVCSMHGGKTPLVAAAAARREAEKAAGKVVAKLLDNPNAEPVLDPVTHLQRLGGRLEAALGQIGALIDAGEALTREAWSDDIRVKVAVWERLVRELRRLLVDMARLDLEGRQVAAAERWGAEIHALLQAVFVELALSPAQWERVPVVVSRHLVVAPAELEAGEAVS